MKVVRIDDSTAELKIVEKVILLCDSSSVPYVCYFMRGYIFLYESHCALNLRPKTMFYDELSVTGNLSMFTSAVKCVISIHL